jgi:hypothetical protein
LLLGEVVSIRKNPSSKDEIGLLLGEVVSMKKTLAKDVVCLLVGYSKNDNLTKMKTS